MSTVASGLINPLYQWFGDDGLPLNLGLVYTYAAGSTTPLATYSDAGLSALNSNPVALDAFGKAAIYFTPAAYKIDVKSALGVSIDGYPRDYVVGTMLPIGLGTSGQVLTSTGASSNPTFQTFNSIAPRYTAQTSNYTAVANDLVAATANSFTITLPLASANANKFIWTVNNGTGTITIARTSTDTIGLATTQALNPATATSQGDSLTFVSDGASNWEIV